MGSPILPGRPRRITLVPVALMLVAAGLAVGCLTSFGQTYLDRPLNALVNSASAWLVAPFFAGALMRTPRGGAAAGLVTCALQVVGYYVTAELRGFPAGGSFVVFWTGCAIFAGPVFGLAGQRWRVRPDDLGATVLPAAFIAEGLWVYLHELRYYSTAVLWLAIGAVFAVTIARGALRWLPLTLAIAVAAEIAVSLVYSRAF